MLLLVKPVINHAANAPGLSVNSTRTYAITSVRSGLAVTKDSNDNIVQQPWTESDSQKWKIIPLSGGNFKIECVDGGNVLDVYESRTDNKVQIIVDNFRNTNNNNQRWLLIQQDNGSYKIEAVHSGKVMDVRDGSSDEGAAIQQYESRDSDNQRWILSEVRPKSNLFDKKATVYKHGDYGTPSQELGVGKYDINDLTIGNDQLSSLKVPEGLRVTLYEHGNFRGRRKTFTSDTSWVGDDFNDITSAIVVEKVATLYKDVNYQGTSLPLGVGRYKIPDIEAIGNDKLSSLKVPEGLQVTLYRDDNFEGPEIVVDQDLADLRDYNFNDTPSSIIIKSTGLVIPDQALNYGDVISLKSNRNRWMSARGDGELNTQSRDASLEKFVIVRAGDTKHTRLVGFGDVVALKSQAGNKYVSAQTSNARADKDSPGDGEKFIIARAGNTQSRDFVGKTDVIAFQNINSGVFLQEASNNNVSASATSVSDDGKWTVDSRVNNYTAGAEEDDSGFGVSVCGAEACPNDVCGAAACAAAAGYASFCGADVCGAAACGIAAGLVAACAAAASGIAVCGADFAIVSVCGAAACGTAVGGVGACGGDACAGAICGAAVGALGACAADICGAAACGAAACGAAACAAAACGADACGGDAQILQLSGADVCAAEVGGIDACGADACAANVCAINLCPADACAADACFIDLIPIIPGI